MEPQAWHILNDFKKLIEETQQILRNVAMPSQLSGQIEPLIARWKEADDNFAAILENIVGEAWSMSDDHFKAVRQKVDAHLTQQLVAIEAQIGRRS